MAEDHLKSDICHETQEATKLILIKVKFIDGSVLSLKDVDQSGNVLSIKKLVEEQTEIPINCQRLIFRGKVLQDDDLITKHRIEDENTVHVVRRSVVSPTNRNNDVPNPSPLRNNSTGITAANFHEFIQEQARNRPTVLMPRGMSTHAVNGVGADASVARLFSSMVDNANTVRRSRAPIRDAPSDFNVEHVQQSLLTIDTIMATTQPLNIGNTSSRRSSSSDNEECFSDANSTFISDETESESLTPNDTAFLSSSATHNMSIVSVKNDRRKFYKGQWLDVKDTVNQWLEATVMNVKFDSSETESIDSDDEIEASVGIGTAKVLIHYNGWPTRWDEWIDIDSDRIAPFRTKTVHSASSPHLSPSPVTWVRDSPSVGNNDDVRDLLKQTHNMMLQLLPRISHIYKSSDPNNFPENAETETKVDEEELKEAVLSIAPLFDRFGRLLSDFAPLLTQRPTLRAPSPQQVSNSSSTSQDDTVDVSTSQDNTSNVTSNYAPPLLSGTRMSSRPRFVPVNLPVIDDQARADLFAFTNHLRQMINNRPGSSQTSSQVQSTDSNEIFTNEDVVLVSQGDTTSSNVSNSSSNIRPLRAVSAPATATTTNVTLPTFIPLPVSTATATSTTTTRATPITTSAPIIRDTSSARPLSLSRIASATSRRVRRVRSAGDGGSSSSTSGERGSGVVGWFRNLFRRSSRGHQQQSSSSASSGVENEVLPPLLEADEAVQDASSNDNIPAVIRNSANTSTNASPNNAPRESQASRVHVRPADNVFRQLIRTPTASTNDPSARTTSRGQGVDIHIHAILTQFGRGSDDTSNTGTEPAAPSTSGGGNSDAA